MLVSCILIIVIICSVFALYVSINCILSSAADGPDLLTEELNLVRNMNLAVKEERYNDAGILYIVVKKKPPVFLVIFSV